MPYKDKETENRRRKELRIEKKKLKVIEEKKSKEFIKKEILEVMYIKQGIPMHKIAQDIDVSIGTVYKYLKMYNIPTRDQKTTFTAKGLNHTKEAKEKISKAHKGKEITKEAREKMSESSKLKTLQGHKKTRTDGYVSIYYPTHPEANKDGYMMEHRLVMEKVLKRILVPKEIAHHINGNRSDNRIENLILFHTQRDHLMYHKYFKNMEEKKNA